MKRITLDIREDKLPFFIELLQQLDFVALPEDQNEMLRTNSSKGMYDAIISLQQGKGFAQQQDQSIFKD